MQSEAIQMIFDRFGESMDSLVPEVIKYSIHMNVIYLICGIISLIGGILLLSWVLKELNKVNSDIKDGLCLAGTIASIIMIVVGAISFIGSVFELIAISSSSEVYAYKTILHWIGD